MLSLRLPPTDRIPKNPSARRRLSVESGYTVRKPFSVLLFLLAGFILLVGFAVSQDAGLRTLPVATASLPQSVTADRTDQLDLQRAGYILGEKGGDSKTADRMERSYTFQGSPGFSATLLDTEYPAHVSPNRDLVFAMTFSVKEGRSPRAMAGLTPKLVATAQNAMSQNPAVEAGLSYLARAAESRVTLEALQTAVSDYLRQYRQPSTPIHEVCSGCGSQDGFGDEYHGGPEMHRPLDVQGTGWTIAGIRHYLNGEGLFTLEVTAKIPRNEKAGYRF